MDKNWGSECFSLALKYNIIVFWSPFRPGGGPDEIRMVFRNNLWLRAMFNQCLWARSGRFGSRKHTTGQRNQGAEMNENDDETAEMALLL
jgi:hypothetical protein